MPTADYEYEQRPILYKDSITRAEIEAIVRQRYRLMSRTGTKSCNGGQALDTSKPTRRNRKQEDSSKGDRAGAKNDQNSSTKDVGKK